MGYRRKKTDANQKDIVMVLRQIPGVKVDTDHDDILVGYKGRNYWFEIKNPEAITKQGRPAKDKRSTQQKQKKLDDEWPGQYDIVWNLDQILKIMGFVS